MFTSGTRLILPYDGSNFNSDMRINTPSSAIGYTYYYTPLSNTSLNIYSDGNGNGSITNISVKEVGQNWNLGAGWSIGEDKATSDGSADTALFQSISFNPSTLKIKFEVSDLIQGSVRLWVNKPAFTQLLQVSSNGSYETTVSVSSGANNIYFYSTTNFIGSITNISVIEITSDTNLPRINYENFSYQDALGSELVTNGGFDSDTAWAKLNGSTISGGVGNVTANGDLGSTGNNWSLNQNIGMALGSTYKVSLAQDKR